MSLLHVIRHHESAIWTISATSDGNFLITAGSEDAQVVQWLRSHERKLSTWAPRDEIKSNTGVPCHTAYISGVFCFEMNGEPHIATSDINDSIFVWKAMGSRLSDPVLSIHGDLLWLVNCLIPAVNIVVISYFGYRNSSF